MDMRLALYEVSARHGLDAVGAARLETLAGLHEQPRALARRVAAGVAILAAGLGGFGVILWLAANWDLLGRFGRFALLQSALLAFAAGAVARPAWRTALGLLALLCSGGMLAYFGQTYQTGADPWQLFALWAVLCLPLCVGVRSDVVWTPWVVVAMTAVSLWMAGQFGSPWYFSQDLTVQYLGAWAMALGLVLLVSPALWRWTGAGRVASRLALTLAVTSVTLTGVGSLFVGIPLLLLGLAVLLLGALAVALLVNARLFDLYALCVLALGINVLLVAALAYLLFRSLHLDTLGAWLLMGVAAAALLAGTVSVLVGANRRFAVQQEPSA